MCSCLAAKIAHPGCDLDALFRSDEDILNSVVFAVTCAFSP